MQVVLHSNYFHLIVILLIILDVVVVLFELLLDVGALGKCMTRWTDRGSPSVQSFSIAFSSACRILTILIG